jgi:ABC-type sugar transport system ATPase subunit
MNLLAGEVHADGFHPTGAARAIALPAAPGGKALLGVRSEHLHPAPVEGAALTGRVLADEYFGAWRDLHVETACGRLVCRAPTTVRHAPGETVGLAIDPARARLFDPVSGKRIA